MYRANTDKVVKEQAAEIARLRSYLLATREKVALLESKRHQEPASCQTDEAPWTSIKHGKKRPIPQAGINFAITTTSNRFNQLDTLSINEHKTSPSREVLIIGIAI